MVEEQPTTRLHNVRSHPARALSDRLRRTPMHDITVTLRTDRC